ncbi:glycoside hydrolase [Thiocapsa imhoffii]|uniref:Glycoside hydrolase n=1 Tax=Thiocapsa imhoffii TaxID=382777 RepID=A0A9X1B7S2_9GAMM|nr:C40 family peptidase [Thiocapsa imhoffii]MBK1643310.1 glycoside hydrolase [Thiocapsa imhoffii]
MNCSTIAIAIVIGALMLPGCATHRLNPADASRGDVVLAGLSQVGTPYAYGGTRPGEGLDCSGLTYYAHHVAGVRIPRVSLDQFQAAKPVPGRRLRPGDMVFFETAPGQYHVGLMVDDERFVHASTSRRQVRIDRLNTPYWQARYLGAGTYFD